MKALFCIPLLDFIHGIKVSWDIFIEEMNEHQNNCAFLGHFLPSCLLRTFLFCTKLEWCLDVLYITALDLVKAGDKYVPKLNYAVARSEILIAHWIFASLFVVISLCYN